MIINDLQQEKIISEYNSILHLNNEQKAQQIENTRQILKDTAEKINIKEISASLLLMAYNLDALEKLNNLTFEGGKNV